MVQIRPHSPAQFRRPWCPIPPTPTAHRSGSKTAKTARGSRRSQRRPDMSNLPDELWRSILEMGVETSRLGHRDLCCLAIASRRLRRLSSDPSLWSALLARDFPPPASASCASSSSTPSKSLYKTKFERDRARKLADWRLEVLNVESQIAICLKNVEDFRGLLVKEHDKWKAASAELSNLDGVRRASVALNVWQPEVVRSSQRKMVEQCTVPIEFRVSALQMEIKVCKQQIAIYNNAYNDQKRKLGELKEALSSLKYHPVHSFELQKYRDSTKRKQKKLKH